MRKIRSILCALLLTLSLSASPALASAVTVHGGGGLEALGEGEYVSDVAEGGGTLYFMVSEQKIIAVPAGGAGSAVVYTPGMVADGLYFLQMEPAASGGLWVTLEDRPNVDADRRVVLFRDGQVAAQQASANRAGLSAEGAVWEEESQLVCWDGVQLTRCALPVDPTQASEPVLWNGRPCFEEWGDTGRVLALLPGGGTETLFSLPEGVRFAKASLFTGGGALYLSYCTEAGGRRTARLDNGAQLCDRYYHVQRARLQPDGAVQLAVTGDFGNTAGYNQVSIIQDSVTERSIGEYLAAAEVEIPETGEDGLPSGWRYRDSQGNQWIYSGKTGVKKGAAAVSKVTPDGTAVSFTAQAPSGFALYHRGAAVSFDVEPYITDTGFTMVPVRGAAYLLNADITWDGAAQTVTVRQGEHELVLTIGSAEAAVDGAPVPLGTPAVITGGRTMLPLRFLTEALGGTIRWENGAVYID